MKKQKILYLFIAGLTIMSCNISEQKSIKVDYEKKIDSLLSLLTLEEKVGMIHASSSFTSGGVERLGIPELVMSDGPHGVRHEHTRDWKKDTTVNDSATYLPTGITLASTWNKKLGYQFGSVLGSEANARGKDVILGPGLNIIRTPLNGRNFEYLSEDPYLAAQMGIGYIKGVQDQGIAACAKHFTANNQETNRTKVDVQLSERALQEIYLPAFKAAVMEADVLCVMGAYNKLRGQYCTHNKYLINKVLKGDFGFTGVLMSDWAAVHDTKEALLYGTDLEMGTDLDMLPDPDYNKFYLADSALAMIKRGEVDESYVDEKVKRILRVMFKTNVIDGERISGSINTKEHQEIALKVAEEGIVLLKNDGLLPLKKENIKKVAVIGHNATRKFCEGGGSSQVKALYEITPLEGIKNLLGDDVEVIYAEGYESTENNVPNMALMENAVKIAKNVDAVIFIGGWIHNFDQTKWGGVTYDSEGGDKKNIDLIYGQESLINKLADVNDKLAVVIIGGSNVAMKGWLDNVGSVIHAWYTGMEGGTAIANILFGKVNPSGKLPVTFADSPMDYPSHAVGEYPGKNLVVNYTEDIFVGYRYFDTENITPVFPFGHGLSYTEFEYSNIRVKYNKSSVLVTFNLKNTGEMAGAEVAQLYVSNLECSEKRPLKELKGFEKIDLNPGEMKEVQIKLDNNAFSYFSEIKNSWVEDPGKYELQIGSSSGDIRLNKTIDL